MPEPIRESATAIESISAASPTIYAATSASTLRLGSPLRLT
jgi:hypothetical protein